MIIRCTQRLAKKLKVKLPVAEPAVADSACWFANLFWFARRPFMIAVESRTMASILFPGVGVNSGDAFHATLVKEVVSYIRLRRWNPVLNGVFGLFDSAVTFCRTNDRRIVGTMNDLVQQSKYILEEGPETFYEICNSNNDMPMGILGGAAPDDQVARIEARFRSLGPTMRG